MPPQALTRFTSTLTLVITSLCLSSLVISIAYHKRKQVYPSLVYLSKSNISLSILYLQLGVLSALFVKILKSVFFGQLRQLEIESVIEKLWFAIIETCIAFALFRETFTLQFFFLFVFLLVVKSFHWICEERVDSIERTPFISLLFNVRIVSLLITLVLINWYCLVTAFKIIIKDGSSVQLIFGFEYAILWLKVLNITFKYILHTIDINMRSPVVWVNKATYLLYAEAAISFCLILCYLWFMYLMMVFNSFPVYVARPFYLAVKTFNNRCRDIVMSQRAVAIMNMYYPFPTEDELTANSVCIICREDMLNAREAKKLLPCNHIFHIHCLQTWFQRQQKCPTCRLDVLSTSRNVASQPPSPPHPSPPATSPPPSLVLPPMPNFPFPPINQSFPSPHSLPFMPQPPPMPNLDLGKLSHQELIALEGEERSALETRINTLRNIQTLLDAATVQFYQYLSLSSTFPCTPHASSSHAPSASTTTHNTVADPVNNLDTDVLPSHGVTNDMPSIPVSTINTSSESTSGNAILRQKRLLKFDNSTKTDDVDNEN